MIPKCCICGVDSRAFTIDNYAYCEAHQHVAGDQDVLDILDDSAQVSMTRLRRELMLRGWDVKELLGTMERMHKEGFVVRVPTPKSDIHVMYWRAR